MNRKKSFLGWILIGFLILWIVCCVFPIWWTFITSIKSPGDAATLPPSIFFKPSLENYKTVLLGGKGGFYSIVQEGFWNNLVNSFIVAVLSTIITMMLGAMSSYYITRYYKGSNLVFWILSIRMMPPIAVIIPYYLMINYIGLTDSVISLILIYSVFNLPLTIWLICSYIKKIPRTYDEMATMDGMTNWNIFWKIIFPLSKPAVITSALLTFIFSWNEFLFAVVLSGVKSKTLPVLATGFITERGIIWGQLTATSIIITFPIFILALYMQKYFINGMSIGLRKK